MIYSANLVETVSRYLTDFDTNDPDYQYVHWSKADLAVYFKQAVVMVGIADSTAAKCVKELPLTGEPFYELPDGCDTVVRAIAYRDAFGTVSTNVRLTKEDKEKFVIGRPVCASDNPSNKALAIRVTSDGSDFIYVDSDHKDGTIILSCSCTPEVNGDIADLSSKYEPIVFWWMVSMAFGTDIESAPMRERSDAYWKRGADLLMLMSPKAKQVNK